MIRVRSHRGSCEMDLNGGISVDLGVEGGAMISVGSQWLHHNIIHGSAINRY